MRVLVVEDELRMARLLKQGLSEEGHLVTLASSGIEALEMAKSFSFDIVVLDVMLPGLDGINVARRLRGQQNHVPILMYESVPGGIFQTVGRRTIRPLMPEV